MAVLSKKAIENGKRMFQQADTDGSGFIEWGELKAILTKIAEVEGFDPPTDEQVNQRMKVVDTSGDGKISLSEFLSFLEAMKIMMICAAIFSQVDKDKSGSIDKGEFKALLTLLYKKQGLSDPSDETTEKYFKAIDKSGDGLIDFYEFADFMIPVLLSSAKRKK